MEKQELDFANESRLDRQSRLERQWLHAFFIAGLVTLALMFAWSVYKVFAPKGHIDTLAKARLLTAGMHRSDVVRLLGKPDTRAENFRGCGLMPVSYHDVYYDDKDRHRMMRVAYEGTLGDVLMWVEVQGRDEKLVYQMPNPAIPPGAFVGF